MLQANAVFNIFAGVFDVRNCVFRVLNYVRQNIAVVFDALAFDSLCFDYVLANTLSCSTFCYANCDSIIRVSNSVIANPGLIGARPLRSGASNKLCIVFPRKDNLC